MSFNAHKIKVHILVVTDYELYIIEINRELTSHTWFPVGPCITPNYPILKLYQEPGYTHCNYLSIYKGRHEKLSINL